MWPCLLHRNKFVTLMWPCLLHRNKFVTLMWPCLLHRNKFVTFMWPCLLHRNKFLYNKTNYMHQISHICFVMKLYMFRTVRLSIIRNLFTVHSAMVYVMQLSSRTSWSCSKALYKPAWHVPLLSVQWKNSWWWTDELSETCRVSWRNKFVKLVHLLVVGFITKSFLSLMYNVSTCIVTKVRSDVQCAGEVCCRYVLMAVR
jgi:hypothetical protein